MNTHPEQWASHVYSARGAVGGSVPCSRTPQSWVLKEDTPPTNNPCRTWDSNPQPLDYESDSLTIRPRLPSGIHLQESLPSSFDPLTLALSILILFLKKIKKHFCILSIWFFLFIIQLTKAKKASNTSLLCSIFFLFRYFTIKKSLATCSVLS